MIVSLIKQAGAPAPAENYVLDVDVILLIYVFIVAEVVPEEDDEQQAKTGHGRLQR